VIGETVSNSYGHLCQIEAWPSRSSGPGILHWRHDKAPTGDDMVVDYILGGAVTIFITAYLVYALLFPERF